MKLFVESWESVLNHLDGMVSKGHAAVHSKQGKIEQYKSRGRILYIHHLEVGLVREEELKAYYDSETQRIIEGRRAPSSGKWWLCKTPSAYAVGGSDVGCEKMRAKLSQLK